MGCVPSRNQRPKVIVLNPEQISRYPRQGKVVIKTKSPNGKLIGHSNCLFQLPEPAKLNSRGLDFLNGKFWVSSCILPGVDPRGECMKSCQDNCLFLSNGFSILLGLFDGHGSDGDKVSQFCCTFLKSFYNERALLLQDSAEEFLLKMTEECDIGLRTKSFDILYSGSTAVIVLLVKEGIFSASLGDSRALIATTAPPSVLPAPVAQFGEERKVLEEVKARRGSQTNPLITPVQLTKDQKPEDPEELARITKSGGRVQRLLDAAGNRIGPYRVWESNSNAPGLAMSRSIGDLIAKKIGVISTPIITKYVMNTETDLFIVLASDGVWDVMDNVDVVSFVECFREKSQRGNIKLLKPQTDVTPDVTCVSHLLCEESRLRWYSIVEDEDVMIDDISCIVLELKKGDIPISFNSKRIMDVEEPSSRAEEEQIGLKRGITINEIVTRDPRRGSIVIDKMLLESAK